MTEDPREVMTRPAPGPDVTVPYGAHPDHLADLFWPDAHPASGVLVLLVHGGFWRSRTDRVHTRPACAGLTGAGHAVAAIEYRRVGQDGGGWPGTLDDVAAAVDAVPDLVRSAAADRGLRLTATVLAGHSAGGHLVTWAVSRPCLPPGSPWHRADAGADGAVSLGGVVDLALAHRLGLGDGAVAALLHGAPADVPDRYAVADPAGLTPSAPVTLVHGLADDIVPIEVARSYAAAAGPAATLVPAPSEHFGVIDPLSAAWPLVLSAVAGAAAGGGPAPRAVGGTPR